MDRPYLVVGMTISSFSGQKRYAIIKNTIFEHVHDHRKTTQHLHVRRFGLGAITVAQK
jgi:hypothetical protein